MRENSRSSEYSDDREFSKSSEYFNGPKIDKTCSEYSDGSKNSDNSEISRSPIFKQVCYKSISVGVDTFSNKKRIPMSYSHDSICAREP